MYELQPLRLQAGWKIEYNNFTEFDLAACGKRDSFGLHEDLLRLLNEQADLRIDLGWYPGYDENEDYVLLLIGHDNWVAPLEKVVTKSKTDIIGCIETWVDVGFWKKYSR